MFEIPKRELKGSYTSLPLDDIHFGSGSLAQLGPALEANGVKRALLITGNTLARDGALVEQVKEAAGGRVAAVFSEMVQHVPRQMVLKAAAMAREEEVDGLICFGGGSPNDTAKAVMIALAEGIDTAEGFDAVRIKFRYPDYVEIPPITGDCLPLFAIPTTLSAGEFTYFAGVTDEVRKVKDLYVDKKITAKAVILDPDLTLPTPEWLWLSTGMRAVDHCVEAICSTTAQPFTDALAARALDMLVTYLPQCKADPSDLVARGQCQVASWLSVFGLGSVTLGLSHGIGHQLGARCDVPHGITSCVMLHHTMGFNRSHTADQQAWIADIMGVETSNMDADVAAQAAQRAMTRFVESLDLPTRLSQVGVTEDEFPALAKDALEDLIVATNPRPVESEETVVELLRSSL